MIDIEHISKNYPETGTLVFRDFTAHIGRGEFAVLTGASGSGKTTLIKMLLKETAPDGGRILVDGRDISTIKRARIPDYRRSFGVIFQDFRLIRDITALENIKLALRINETPASDHSTKIWNVAKMLRITEILKKMPDELSGGEQQKVCLARAIINNPKILLADEPTSNLDPTYSREIMSLFEVIRNMGTTLVVASQDPIIVESETVRNIYIRA